MWRLALIISVTAMVALLTAGCWDFHEIDRRAFVLALGIDFGKEKKYLVSAQILVPIAASPEAGAFSSLKPFRVEAFESDFLGDFANQFSASVRHTPDYGHLVYFVLNEEVAKQDLSEFEWFARSHRLPGAVQFTVTKDQALAVVSATTPVDPIPATYVSEGTLRKLRLGVGVILSTLREVFVRAYNNPLEDAYAQGLTSAKFGLNFDGLAVFSKLRLAGWLTPDEAAVLKSVKRSSLATHYISSSVNGKRITAEASGGKARYGVRLDDGGPTLWAKVDLEVELKEFPGGSIANVEEQRSVESALAQEYSSQIEAVLRKLQSLNSDPLGFGERLRRVDPTNEALAQWHGGVYQNLPISVEVKVTMATRGFRR